MSRFHTRSLIALTLAFAAAPVATMGGQAPNAPLAVDTARVVLAGTSNIHAYTATSSTVRLVHVKAPAPSERFWDEVTTPGGLGAFEVAIPVTSLQSDKDGLDKNMHKALKAQQFPEITFRLSTIAVTDAGAHEAVGVLRIAGVERDVRLALTFERQASGLLVKGKTDLLMTDFGITPPKAMLGMLKTDPKVTVTFETVLAMS